MLRCTENSIKPMGEPPQRHRVHAIHIVFTTERQDPKHLKNQNH